MERIHYIYLTTNLINNKKYIGQRLVPENIKIENDKYLGSGTILIRAIKKHGRESFKKEILEICHSRMKADELEKYYFSKYDVLNKKEEFYNRALPGQYWREKGHSESVSKKMKEFYSDDENYKKRHGMTKVEYIEKGKIELREKEIKKYQRNIKRLNKKIEKAKYNHYRKLTEDLRKEYNDARSKMIWKTKKRDPEFLEAVKRGKAKIDYKKINENSTVKFSKSHTKNESIIYEKLWVKQLSVNKLKSSNLVLRYLAIKYRYTNSLEKSLKKIYDELICKNIDIDFQDLLFEAKSKYSHLYG